MQESVGTLSIQTVQAEHEPRSQTTFVPGEAKRVSEGLSERNARLDGERVSDPIHMEHDRNGTGP